MGDVHGGVRAFRQRQTPAPRPGGHRGGRKLLGRRFVALWALLEWGLRTGLGLALPLEAGSWGSTGREVTLAVAMLCPRPFAGLGRLGRASSP